MTDDNDSFAAACRAADEKKAKEDLATQLNRKLEEQRKEQDARLKELASKDSIAYDQERKTAAKDLGVRTTTLDGEVEKVRRQRLGLKKPEDDGSKIKDFEQAAGDLISEPNVLDRFGEAVQKCGLVGENRNAKILFLAHTTRLFEKPVSIAIKGISSGGKSFTVETVLRFCPEEAFFVRTGMSDHALPYSDEDFKHRHIVLFEHAGMDSERASYFIRSLLSENRLTHETVQKIDGELKAVVLVKEGPTGLITTTTVAALHPENETRLLSLGVIDSPEQTAAVMKAIGIRAATGVLPNKSDLEKWIAFQRWLAVGETRVVVPFAVPLAEKIPPAAVRLRRDFSTLISLIKANALLQRSARARDPKGHIIATVEDYAAVHSLVAELFAESVEVAVPKTVRSTVEGVKLLAQPEVSLANLSKHLRLGKATVSARVQKAVARGFLVNREDKKGLPARLVLGDPLPEERQVLPDPEVFGGDRSGVRSQIEGVTQEIGSTAESPPSEDEKPRKSSQIGQQSTAETKKGAESGRLTEGAALKTATAVYPPENRPNTRTVPPNGGNGHATWPTEVPEGRQLSAKVTIREIWPPGLGPPGDDIFDLR
jgi:hypothetical protein